jgi:hypothetical protein
VTVTLMLSYIRMARNSTLSATKPIVGARKLLQPQMLPKLLCT